jgi:hypothetical protein
MGWMRRSAEAPQSDINTGSALRKWELALLDQKNRPEGK